MFNFLKKRKKGKELAKRYKEATNKLFELDAAYFAGSCSVQEYLSSQLDLIKDIKAISKEINENDD